MKKHWLFEKMTNSPAKQIVTLIIIGILSANAALATCPSGTYSYDFSAYIGGPLPNPVMCVSNWETPDQFWQIYTNDLATNQPPVYQPPVFGPGDLWLELVAVSDQAFSGGRVYRFVTLNCHGLVIGTNYVVEASSSLASGSFVSVGNFVAADTNSVFTVQEGPGSLPDKMFFRLRGPPKAVLTSVHQGLLEFTCGLFLSAFVFRRVF